MASTNQTSHLQLNQWEADDQVRRVDFNSDNLKLDDALMHLTPVKGEYTGTGNGQKNNLEFGFWPQLAVVISNRASNSANAMCIRDSISPEDLFLTETGIMVTDYYNNSGEVYTYLVFP